MTELYDKDTAMDLCLPLFAPVSSVDSLSVLDVCCKRNVPSNVLVCGAGKPCLCVRVDE